MIWHKSIFNGIFVFSPICLSLQEEWLYKQDSFLVFVHTEFWSHTFRKFLFAFTMDRSSTAVFLLLVACQVSKRIGDKFLFWTDDFLALKGIKLARNLFFWWQQFSWLNWWLQYAEFFNWNQFSTAKLSSLTWDLLSFENS